MADPITVTQFRTNFPEFAYRQGKYPDGQVQFWLDIAYKRLRACRWADLLDLGAQLYTAHNLVLAGQAADAAKRGGAPGQGTGPVNSKGVDKVSVGYDTTAGAVEGAGNYNLTTYGTRFRELENLAGMGPVQVGTGMGPVVFPPFPSI